jgi:hypothetical protein
MTTPVARSDQIAPTRVGRSPFSTGWTISETPPAGGNHVPGGILAAAQDVADRIFAKLGVRTRTAAIAAIANRLVDPTPPPTA